MSWEEVSALSAVATLAVIAAAAAAAIVQLRHMRSANALNAIFGFVDRWMTREFQEKMSYVFGGELDQRLKDANYRQELMCIPPDILTHPEVSVLDFWEQVGSVVKTGFVDEIGFMRSGAPGASVLTWTKLTPVVAIMRRTMGTQLYENFEWLAARSKLWLHTPAKTYPKDTPHLPTPDPFPEDVKPTAQT